MTTKDMKQAHKDLCALCGDLHDKGMDPLNALELEQNATAIRTALAPFDASALAVVGWQYKYLPITPYSEWAACNHLFYAIAKSHPANYIVREIYAAPEAT